MSVTVTHEAQLIAKTREDAWKDQQIVILTQQVLDLEKQVEALKAEKPKK